MMKRTKMTDSRESLSQNSLLVLENEDTPTTTTTDEEFNTSHRKQCLSGHRPPRPDSGSYARTPTPSKQISLQTIPRKQDRGDQEGTDPREILRDMENLNIAEGTAGKPVNGHSSDLNKCFLTEAHLPKTDLDQKTSEGPVSEGAVAPPSGEQSDSSDDEDEDDEEEEEEEKKKAPNQLLMEFITCVMEEDFVNAEKLCRMILLYEPDNPEALKFHPVIEERLRLDKEAEEASDDSGEEGSSDEDEDSGEEGESSDSDDDDSSDESSEEESNEEGSDDGVKPDSGIASASPSTSD
ncbi:hypothetical protein ScPMuIL_012698 [Solemya velum]